jgi:hypothetical protein
MPEPRKDWATNPAPTQEEVTAIRQRISELEAEGSWASRREARKLRMSLGASAVLFGGRDENGYMPGHLLYRGKAATAGDNGTGKEQGQ